MVDRIQKALRKLQPKERQQLKRIIERIVSGDVSEMDVKKLQGAEDVYRVRKGDIRVIYRTSDDGVRIIAVERRSDTTYDDV